MLTGFMGTGKTTVGRVLAERLRKPFIDTDARIEEAEGCSIAVLFATKGEPYFRSRERQTVADAVREDAIVATGGGAIVDADNFACMRAAGPIVCLAADPEVIVQRTGGSARPLLETADRRARVSQLLAERAAVYARADLTIDTSHRTVAAVVEEILSFLHSRSPHGGHS